MSVFEVTNAQFRLFRPTHFSQPVGKLSFNLDTMPVTGVTWDDAKTFCDWLSRQEGIRCRLPTEAEWEYACRAGAQGRYWWGESETAAGRYANVADLMARRLWPKWQVFNTNDGQAGVSAVGRFAANPFGLHDMLGNVQEWCGDWHQPSYSATQTVNPKGPSHGRHRVARGGAWNSFPNIARCAARPGVAPNIRDGHTGFRVVVEP